MHFDAPLTAPAEAVKPEWIDYNGHLNMAYYNVLFDHAVDYAFSLLGCGPDYVSERNMSFFTVETHVCYLRELKSNDNTRVRVQLLGHDAKRIRFYQELFHEDGWLSATSESLLLHVDMSGPKAAPFPPDILTAIEALAAAHARLPLPQRAGRSIRLRPRTQPG